MARMTTPGIRLLSVLPCFVVPDVEASVAHYREMLGFRDCGIFGQKPEQFGIIDRAEGQGFHFKSTASCGESSATVAPARGRRNRENAGLGGGGTIEAYLRIPDADRLHADYVRRGAKIVQPLANRPWNQREFVVEDDNGNLICFGADTTGAWPPDGFTTSPELVVADIPRTVAFYREKLGFTRAKTFFDPPAYAIVGRQTVNLHFCRATPGFAPRSNRPAADVWDAFVEVVGVEALAKEFTARGATLTRGPESTFYNSREIELADPDGYHICFGELLGD
jgi:catechol 2,3-dioxygenase-like lactoylglutathione lyase family enzyme